MKYVVSFFWTCALEAKGDADVFRVSSILGFTMLDIL